ncbi:hypothetical protein [Streptosporangium sp. NPDC051022]|uniref:hypothetical protein n=1 Tax=Streptosporangium sp. NPDC051022 TaxID=3155752 RepID=UPI003421B6E0
MTTPLEDGLRQTFASRAATVPEHTDPYGATLRRVRRTRRRRRAAAGGALALTVALVLVNPVVSRGTDSRPATTTVRERTGPDWPARGSLAGDTALLATLRARLGDPEARILYAGDRDGRRVVVAVSPKNPAMGGTVVLYGDAGTPVEDLDLGTESPMAGGSGREAVVWISADDDHPLVVLGPPQMTAVKISPFVSYRADGTPVRHTRTLRADQGLLLTTLPDAKLGHAAIRIRLGERFERPMSLGWTISYDENPAFHPALTRAAAAAAGHVNVEQARGLLQGLGTLATPPWRLTYRYLWGGSLGSRRDALVATVSGPGTPTFLAVQTTYTSSDGSTEQQRLGRLAGDLSRPVGWTTAVGGSPDSATAAVYVPGGAGSRVELRDGARTIAVEPADATGLAVFSPGLPEERLRACEYRVLNAKGEVVHRGRLDLGALYTAVTGNSDW